MRGRIARYRISGKRFGADSALGEQGQEAEDGVSDLAPDASWLRYAVLTLVGCT